MKLKNIFITTIAAGILTACVSEDIDNTPSNVIEGKDTSISLKLNVAGTQVTKAYIGEEGNRYELANPEELKVNKVAVAIFKTNTSGTPTDRVGFKEITNPTATGLHGEEVPENDTLAYKVDDIAAKTGNVRIVVIANSKLTNLASYETYADLKNAVEQNLTTEGAPSAEFNPGNLVKVGEINYPLSTSNNQNIIVPLTQLAARINIRFNVDELLQPDGDPYFHSSLGDTEYTEEQMINWQPNKLPTGANVYGGGELDFTIGDKKFHRKNGAVRVVQLNNYTVKYIQPYIMWQYKVKEVTIINVETESKIMLDMTNPESNSLLPFTPVLDNDNDVITFYSYEKNVATQHPLTITTEGDLIQAKVDSVKTWTGNSYIFWLKNSTTGGLPEPDENGIYQLSEPGTGSGGRFWIEPLDPSKIQFTSSDGEQVGEPMASDLQYKAEINPRKSPKCNTDGVIHGNNYDVTGQIDLSTLAVNFSTQAVPWTARYIEIEANIQNIHYLFVKEHTIRMPNINTYTFEYASDLGITGEILEAKFTGYEASGAADPGDYDAEDDQYPDIHIDPVKHEITVSMRALPVNFVPTYIKIKITTTDGSLSDEVSIIHYPTPYVEVHHINGKRYDDQSDNNYWGVPASIENYGGRGVTYSDHDNFNIYTITSIASGSFRIGNPTTKDVRVTDGSRTLVEKAIVTNEDPESNQLVSPQFVFASQRGVTGKISYENARRRCALYTEQPYMVVGSWRIPTEAELKYISNLQRHPDSAVKDILEGSSYWTASRRSCNMRSGDVSEQSSNTYVRCVHDVY